MIVSGWILPANLALKYGDRVARAAHERLIADGVDDPEIFDALSDLSMTKVRLDQIAARMAPVVPKVHSCSSFEFRGEKLTSQQVAAQIGTSPSFVVRLCRDGRLTARQLPNRVWQIDSVSVDEYMEGRSDDRARAS